MSELKINAVNSTITSQNLHSADFAKSHSQDGFEVVLKEAMAKLVEIQSDTNNAIQELANGGDITQAVIALQKAEMAFQFMIEVRNRLISAYEEIQRMQV